MKNILTLFILLLVSLFGYGQNADFDGIMRVDTIQLKDNVGAIQKRHSGGGPDFEFLQIVANKALILQGGGGNSTTGSSDVVIRVPGGAFNDLVVDAFNDGRVGIGHDVPAEKLDINGAIRIGNTISANEGTLRYDGTKFTGYSGGQWRSLGGMWEQNGDDIYKSNAGQVGIGITVPSQALHVKDGNVFIHDGELQLGNGSGKSTITPVVAGLSILAEGNLNLRASGDGNITIKSDSLDEYARFDGENGRLGIGESAPSAIVHVVAQTGDDALRVQTSGSATQMRIFDNGAVSIGTNWGSPQMDEVLIQGNVIHLDDVIQLTPRSSFPGHAAGRLFYHSGNDKLYLSNGTSWTILN